MNKHLLVSSRFLFLPMLMHLFAFGVALNANADNSAIASLWNQFESGKYCYQVSSKEIASSGFACPKKDQPSWWLMTSSDYLERLVLEQAGKDQVTKNNCIADEISALKADKSDRQIWISTVAAAWLAEKKAELIIQNCDTKVKPAMEAIYNKTPALAGGVARISSFDLERGVSPFDKYLTGQDDLKKWVDICYDQETMSALHQAKSWIEESLPVISSPSFMQTMEKNRNLLTMKATGKPITDAELLNADVSDDNLSKIITLHLTNGLDSELQSQLQQISNDRAKRAQDIANYIKKNPNANDTIDGMFDSNTRDYLFEDGTVFDVLVREGFITGSSQENKSPGAACILAKFQPTGTGQMLDFGLTSIVSAGLALKFIKAFGYLSDLNKLKKLKAAGTIGMSVSGAPSAMEGAWRACVSKIAKSKKAVSVDEYNNALENEALDVQGEVPIARQTLMDSPSTETAACKQAIKLNLAATSQSETSCLKSVLLNFLPLKVSLPIIVYEATN